MDCRTVWLLRVSLLLVLVTGTFAVGIPLLTFPRTSPTRVQLITGIGIPVSLNFESVTIGWVLKAEYFLPENASNVINPIEDPFNVTPQPISSTGRRRRRSQSDRQAVVDLTNTLGAGYDAENQQHFEKYETKAIEVDSGAIPAAAGGDGDDEYYYEDDANDEYDLVDDKDVPQYSLKDVKTKEPNNMDTARFTLYKGLETLVQKQGLPGRPCMLRSICEAAEAQFSYHNGILGELAHIIMSPSTSPDQLVENGDGEYLRAEQMGRNGEPCGQVFRECPVSVLDKFSGMFNTMGGLMNFLG